ncbi:MAG TPA: hypothetical protein VHF23_04575 [Gaiellaceae bacterium]|nr:hypothetical protein [Gaiellaceae bacterium]
MQRIALLLALTLVALLGAACGAEESSEDEQDRQEPPALTAQQVIREFRHVPGQPKLRRAAGSDAAWEQLSLGLNVSPRLQRRFGTFNVYVVKPGRDEAVDSLLTDKETRKALRRGADGIYWERDSLAGSYVAYKRYGANVVLAWWSEREEPVTDGRWERLDRLLSRLVAG